MKPLRYFTFIIACIIFPQMTRAQDCRCITISAPNIQKEQGTVSFKVKNSCNRRIWFSTRGFWMTFSDQGATNTQSRLYKLTNNDPKFFLFRWKQERELVFNTDKLNSEYDRIRFSYSNTTDPQPKSLFGTKTYLCEVDLK